jgi:cytochrome c553
MLAIVMAIAVMWSVPLEPLMAQDEGKRAFDAACAACHGDGGGGGVAPALVPLTVGPNELLATVRNGGTMMTAFSPADVSDSQVAAIERYLRGLTGAPTASLPPATVQPGAGQTARPMVEWPYVGNDKSNSRYSPLADITPRTWRSSQWRGGGGRRRSRCPSSTSRRPTCRRRR